MHLGSVIRPAWRSEFLLGLAWALVTGGCVASPPAVAPPPSPESASEPGQEEAEAAAVPDTPAPAPAAAATSEDPAPYSFAWKVKLEGWNNSVDFTAGGDPVVVNSRHLSLLARHDGSVLAEADVNCLPSHNALFFLDAQTGVLGCDDVLYEVGLPGLTVRRAYELPAQGRRTDIDGFDAQVGAVAYGTREGQVAVLERRGLSYVPLMETQVTGQVETVALSPDLSTLVVGVGAKDIRDSAVIEVYDVQTGKRLQQSPPQERSRVTAMSFSPDGTMIYADAGSFEAGIFDVQTATWRNNFRVGSWMSSSVWLRPDLVAGAGSDGVALFPAHRGGTVELPIPDMKHPTMEGIGASDDGSMFCSGERDGTIACWSNKPLTPSTYRPPAPLVR